MVEVQDKALIPDLPCIFCGKNLREHARREGVYLTLRCVCGVEYAEEAIKDYETYPHRWHDLLRCACGRVRREQDRIVVTKHLCKHLGRLVGLSACKEM